MDTITVAVTRMPHAEGLDLPHYATDHSAGMDLIAAEDAVLAPGDRTSVGTGLAVALPDGCEAQIRPRSGLAMRHGVTLANISSVSLALDGDTRAKYGWLTWEEGAGWTIEQRHVAYDLAPELELLAERQPPGWESLQTKLENGRP